MKPTDKPLEQSIRQPIQGFEMVSRLGAGGMSDVWKVRKIKNGKEYALKIVYVNSKDMARRFTRESGIMGIVNHANIIHVYESGESNGLAYMLMELCEGGNIHSLVQSYEQKRLPLGLASFIILQTLSALIYIHSRDLRVLIGNNWDTEVSSCGIVHRDIKPENILLLNRGDKPEVKLADFGLAKAYLTAGLTAVTAEYTCMGTPEFMPREAVNTLHFTPASDVWGAAACYYYMLTGCYPRNFPPGTDKITAVMTQPVIPIQNRTDTIPNPLAGVVNLALKENPIGVESAKALRELIIKALPDEARKYCEDII